MTGYNGNRWLKPQLDLMVRLVDEAKAAGRRPNFGVIAPQVGHPISSCQQMMTRIRHARLREIALAERASADRFERELNAKQQPPETVHPPARMNIRAEAPFSRSTSTHILVADAELRARIEVCGLTGGLFGDPIPGRSALDEKRSRL